MNSFIDEDKDYRGKTVLVTGASSGIGEAFIRAFAAQGANIILVARSETKLQNLATEMAAEYGVTAHVVVADLAQQDATKWVFGEVQKRDLSVDILVNNAGFGTFGRFEALEPGREHEQVMLNVVAVADLTRTFLPMMTARGYGAVINVASTVAFLPLPYSATYAATKAFVLSLTEALWAENRATGVRVLAVCAGPTETNFHTVSGMNEVANGSSTERVVAEAFRALSRDRSHVVTGGFSNRLLALLPRVLPRQPGVRLAERMLRAQLGASK